MGLISRALIHGSKAILRVGFNALKEITEDPLLSGRILPSRLHAIALRVASQGWTPMTLTSDSEDGSETAINDTLRNPKKDSTSTVLTDSINRVVRTVRVPSSQEPLALQLPEAFTRLRSEQRAGALAALQQIEIGLRQPVLDEWAARCRASTVHHPAGYLFGIIQKAMGGEFKAWANRHPDGRAEGSV